MKNNIGLFHKLTRLYTFYSPIRKGKSRITLAAIKLFGEIPENLIVKTFDGRTLQVDKRSITHHFVYFIGEYERVISDVIKTVVRKDDVCLDVGANIGWYSTLLANLVGKNGQVHSFEPVPMIFEKLENNIRLNNANKNTFLNNVALGVEFKDIQMHIFENLPDGHASLSDFGRKDSKVFAGKMITLDSYLEEKNISNVNFVKIDVEGGELSMLQGADKLFNQEVPPIFEIEMALDTTKGFGYLPNDIIEYMNSKREYDYYAIDESQFYLTKIKGFEKKEKGANVLCVPTNLYSERIKTLKIK